VTVPASLEAVVVAFFDSVASNLAKLAPPVEPALDDLSADADGAELLSTDWIMSKTSEPLSPRSRQLRELL
jgi:hypothetical protein